MCVFTMFSRSIPEEEIHALTITGIGTGCRVPGTARPGHLAVALVSFGCGGQDHHQGEGNRPEGHGEAGCSGPEGTPGAPDRAARYLARGSTENSSRRTH